MLFIFNIVISLNASLGNFRLNQKLLKELYRNGDVNGLISPYSLMTAMQMVKLGSSGKTLKELEAFLKGVSSFDIKDKGVTSSNSFWFNKGLKVKSKYKNDLNKLFNANLFYLEEKNSTDQAKKINKWVADNTKNKITDLVTPTNLDGIIMVLLNSIYFKGNWINPFDKKYTRPAPFYDNLGNESEVDFMFKDDMFRYFENDEFQFIEIPYKENSILYLVLPREIIFKDALDTLSEKYFLNMVASSKSTKVRLHLPKIDLAIKISAKEIFQKLGVIQAFTSAADFSEMVTDSGVYISSIIHKSAVTWDEVGTEAAAATAVMMTKNALFLKPPVDMNINRPFLFYITTSDAKEVLFSGYVQKL